MKKIIFLLFTAYCFLLTGCKPIKQIEYRTQYVDKWTHDSITVEKHDSTVEFQKGDTIYRYQWKTLYKDRWQTKYESTLKTDTITKIIPAPAKTIEVPKKGFLWYSGLLFYISLIIYIIYKLKKIYTL